MRMMTVPVEWKHTVKNILINPEHIAMVVPSNSGKKAELVMWDGTTLLCDKKITMTEIARRFRVANEHE